MPAGLTLPEYCTVNVGRESSHRRKVVLLGLNTEDRSILRADAFGGATIDPLNATAKKMYGDIMRTESGVDTIIPLTHQLMPLDRELAAMKVGFPLIVGGHDHEPYNEVIEGCQIIKTGIDAKNIAICELTWASADVKVPTVSVSMYPASHFEPDAEVTACVKKHKKVIEELEKSMLCFIPKDVLLSSKSMRLHPTTMGLFLCSTLRDALGTECALVSAGNIRANKSYENEKVI